MPNYYIHMLNIGSYITAKNDEHLKALYIYLNGAILFLLNSTFINRYVVRLATAIQNNVEDILKILLIELREYFIKLGDDIKTKEINDILNTNRIQGTIYEVIYKSYYFPVQLLLYDKFYIKKLIHIPILKKIKNNSYFHIWRLFYFK